jgi:hypothetical protein
VADEKRSDGTEKSHMSLRRRLFGPSKQEIWKKLSAEIGATYVEGGFWQGDKVQAQHGEWTITLDSFAVTTRHSTTPYTRMRAPFVNQDGFRFTIYRKGIFSGLGQLLGMQDILVGDPALDDEFIIKANDEQKVQALLSDPSLRTLLHRQPSLHLTVKDDEGWFTAAFPEGVDELYFHVPGIINDLERLLMLYELFAKILDGLCHIGSAYEEDPKTVL